MRPYADNVWIRLLPLETASKSGIVLVEGERKTKGTRRATVIGSGPGYTARSGAFIANESFAGDTVYVDALAGQDWSMDFDPPRHRDKAVQFDSLANERGEYRVVREQEIQAIERNGSVLPLNDRIIVRRAEAPAMTASGLLHIPDDARPKPIRGTVLSVGSGRVLNDGSRRELQLSPGDQVMFNKYSGSDIRIGDEDLLILREDDILGVLDENAAVEAA